jgi:ribonuclease T2
LNRQYDPAPSPKTTNGKPNGKRVYAVKIHHKLMLQIGTPVPAYAGNATIADFLTTLGKLDLLSYMNKYWINQGAPNTAFWAHEFSKHATCYSTFDLPCYGPSYVEHQEVAEFYETAIKYYQRLPTWKWLDAAGIRPSNSTGYSISDIQAALTTGYGALPYTGCAGPAYNTTDAGKGSLDNGKIYFDEAWYYFYVSQSRTKPQNMGMLTQRQAYGRPQDGNWAVQNASVSGSAVTSCATSAGAVKYLERTASSVQ